ncbi:hypothetical protein Rs2_45927 [Raphanus sativus]|nr:hypothetical protein Rs2_45927 [Raphanus sativus]
MRTELQSTTTSIRQLETSVTNELDNIKKLIKGAGYTEDYQNFGGSSPFRTNSPTSRPDHQIPPAFVSTEKVKGSTSATVDGTSAASEGLSKLAEDDVPLPSDIGSSPTQGPAFGPTAAPPPRKTHEPTPSNVGSPGRTSRPADTEGVEQDRGNNDTPPAKSSNDNKIPEVGARMETELPPHDTGAHQNIFTGGSDINTFSDVSSVVEQIISDASISKEIPHYKNVPDQVHGGHNEKDKDSAPLHEHDQIPHPSPAPQNVDSGPDLKTTGVPLNTETVNVGTQGESSTGGQVDTDVGVQRHDACVGDTNPSPSKSKAVDDENAGDDYAEDGTRKSKRKHVSPQRFSPSEPIVRKDPHINQPKRNRLPSA